MKLKDFIRESLVEIAFGVHQAKVAAKDLVAISPGHLNGQIVQEKIYVDFDVAVTVNEVRETDKEGKLGIQAQIEVLGNKLGGELGGGGAVSQSSSTQTASRVVFKVPVYLNSHFRNDAGFDKEVKFMEELSNRTNK